MENSWYSLFVGEEVMENSASPDTRYTEHCALARHMFKQLGAVRTNDTECFYVRCFAADICDDTDLRQQSVFLFFASTTTIAHLLGTLPCV